MNAKVYRQLLRYSRTHLLRAHPWPLPAIVPFPLSTQAAIYIACDAGGRCRYVGSVARHFGSGLRERVAEHLTDPRKRTVWHHVWVVPLQLATAESEVRRLEGVIASHLGPPDSWRNPKAFPPARRLRT